MGGFYGNITDTSKTTFSFDLVYHSRLEMDTSSDEDGIFLGRYVLVDYDDAPIKAYGKKDNYGNVIAFYNTSHFSQNSEIKKKSGVVYEDLAIQENTVSKFYKWTGSRYEPLGKDETPYYTSFETDVKEYGRGYDSTVWVKRFDTNSNKYKYAMIAELNAVVPTLHLVINKPNPSPSTPYFDRDTTNIDYYLHMQGEYGTRVKKLPKQEDMVNPDHVMRSDENIVYNSGKWVTDETGYSIWQENDPEIVPGDIYYNNAGFDPAIRTFSEGTYEYYLIDDLNNKIDGGKKAVVDYGRNQIGFDFGRSGRYYGANADLGVYSDGVQADDIYDWFVRLPGIGNAICKMWDKVYGYREDNKRYLNDALTYEDKTDNLVSYDRNTMIGVMNTAQDLIGYHFISLDEYNPQEIITWPTNIEEMPSDFLITVNLKYDNEITEQSAIYEVLKCIFYSTDENGNKKYYAYHYAPNYGEPVEPEFEDENKTIFKDNKIYYYKENDIYHVANPKTYKTTDANGNIILSTSEYYLATPEWKLAPINTIADNSIQTLIAQIHTMLGTNIGEVRDMNSAQGAINTIKDIITNIDINLAPGRLLHTNNSGIIETVEDTYFPSATWDRDEVLDGAGRWVSRFATIKVLENSTNNNQKNPEVNTIIDGSEQNVATVIESDNDKSHTGTSLVNYKKHTTNNLTLGSRNKWIELYGNAETDSIEFKHSQSPIVSRLRSEQAEGSSYVNMFDGITAEENVILKDSTGFKNFSVNDNATEIKVEPTTDTLEYKSQVSDQNDNRLTIPYMTVDNAGHVVELGTKNFNIPHGFKKITTTTIDDSNESVSLDQAGVSIAENINDTLNLAPRNRWIDIATETTNNAEGEEEDTITWSHRLVPIEHLKTDVVLNGERRTEESEIPTVYRYGLPADKNIQTLDNENGNEKTNTFNVPYIEVDKAGHIVAAETHTVELPENFTTVTLQPQNESTLQEADIVSAEVKLEADTLTDNITLKTTNRWIGLGLTDIENDDVITFGHRLSDIKDVIPLELNGERRADEKYSKVYRYGLPQNKTVANLDSTYGIEAANTFNVPYVEIDEAGHIVYAETNTVTLPENFTTLTLNPQNESSSDEAHTISEQKVLEADTLTDNLTFTTVNRWIGLGLNSDNDEVTFGHRLSDIKDVTPLTLNGERRANEKYEKVYRYGLPQDKDIEDLDTENGVEPANTFNVPYVEIDEAGHIVHAETHTVKLPEGYTTINIGKPQSDDLTSDELAGEATIIADTLTESLTVNPSNKWIRLNAENTAGSDVITIGHEIHKITPTTSAEDLDIENNQKSTFTTQTVTWDAAGHIIGHDTKTWTLPDSFHNFKVIGQSTSVNNGNLSDGNISADDTFDTITFKPSNKWIRLYANEEFDTIEIGHVTQDGKAGSYTGTDLEFAEFGGTVTVYGYKTDEAGHIIDNPTYTLTLPKGSYTEDENNDANILTSLSFTDTTGALIGHKVNIGSLLLADYTTENITSAAVAATDSLNTAIAKLEAQIKAENTERKNAIIAEQNTVNAIAATLQKNIDNEIENRETAISNEESARDEAIINAVQAVWNDLLINYNLELKAPTIESISKTVINANSAVQLTANVNEIENDTYSYLWNTGENSNTITVTQNGDYSCIVTRNHNGWETSSEPMEITVSEIVTESETPTI